jgi:hypothetical protein
VFPITGSPDQLLASVSVSLKAQEVQVLVPA